MEICQKLIEILFNFDTYLNVLIQQCGLWVYLIIFAVIFAETGFVVTPFLPGDSFLFMLGVFAARGALHPFVLVGILMCAAIFGDSANYAIGKYLGNRLLYSNRVPLFKKEHLDRTQHFYKKHGGRTIILARFIPIIRTFAPFVAGVARMDYSKFFIYNVIGGILWVAIFISGGFYFGNIPVVKENFSLVTVLIIGISIMPAIIEFFRSRRRIKQSAQCVVSEKEKVLLAFVKEGDSQVVRIKNINSADKS